MRRRMAFGALLGYLPVCVGGMSRHQNQEFT